MEEEIRQTLDKLVGNTPIKYRVSLAPDGIRVDLQCSRTGHHLTRTIMPFFNTAKTVKIELTQMIIDLERIPSTKSFLSTKVNSTGYQHNSYNIFEETQKGKQEVFNKVLLLIN